jgi:hypothetical protein
MMSGILVGSFHQKWVGCHTWAGRVDRYVTILGTLPGTWSQGAGPNDVGDGTGVHQTLLLIGERMTGHLMMGYSAQRVFACPRLEGFLVPDLP